MLRMVMMVLATTVTLTGAMSADAFASRGAPVGPMGQIFDGVNPVDHPAGLKMRTVTSASRTLARTRR
jgi:hypothetical protein